MKRILGIAAAMAAIFLQPVFPVAGEVAPADAESTVPLLEFRLIDLNYYLGSVEEGVTKTFPELPENRTAIALGPMYYAVDVRGIAVPKVLDAAVEEIQPHGMGMPPPGIPGMPAAAQQLKIKLRAVESQQLAEYAPPDRGNEVMVFVLGRPLVTLPVTEAMTREGVVRILEPRTDMTQLAEQLRQAQPAEKAKRHRK